MKVGDKIEFYLFNVKRIGEVYQVNKDKTVGIVYEDFKYPDTQTLKTIPKSKKEIPPWYILK
jgi:hypothetical protein